MAIICGSLNLLVFIKISSIIKPEKILLLKPINWRGDYPSKRTAAMLCSPTCLQLFPAIVAQPRGFFPKINIKPLSKICKIMVAWYKS